MSLRGQDAYMVRKQLAHSALWKLSGLPTKPRVLSSWTHEWLRWASLGLMRRAQLGNVPRQEMAQAHEGLVQVFLLVGFLS